MKDLYTAARALYLQAFRGEDPAFADALLSATVPQHLMAVGDHGQLASMLLALPYPIRTDKGLLEARYLYAVATDERFRGKGLAHRLLKEATELGVPLFLRPMSPSLFSFYESAGFRPFSPYREVCGEAAPINAEPAIKALSSLEYLRARDALAPIPCTRPTSLFLNLAFTMGGAVGLAGHFAALYAKEGNTVLFKEWYGDVSLAPSAAAYLGATHFTARIPDKNGTPFGVGIGIPEGTTFLAAMD